MSDKVPSREPEPSLVEPAPLPALPDDEVRDYPEPEASVRRATVNSPDDGFLNLRGSPDLSASIVAELDHGAVVEVVSCEDSYDYGSNLTRRWCEVWEDGRSGWVSAAYLVEGTNAAQAAGRR